MGKTHLKMTVNGKEVELLTEPRQLLIHVLREDLNLTGAHIGCESSHCGACTVDMNGMSIKSCTVFAAQAQDAEITTIEGLGSPDGLHVLQEMFKEHHGLQCGSRYFLSKLSNDMSCPSIPVRRYPLRAIGYYFSVGTTFPAVPVVQTCMKA